MSTDTFDPTKPLVMAKFGTLNGHDLHGGARVTIVEEESAEPGEITEEVAERLWNARRLSYREDARPTPVETVAEAAERLTEVDELKGSWFMVRAPWIRATKVQGREAAEQLRAEVVQHGIDTGVEPLPPEDEPTIETPAQITAEVQGDTHANGGEAGLTDS
jgi:allophanate hydrolase subunit 2